MPPHEPGAPRTCPMILHQSLVEQTVDRDLTDRFLKEVVVVKIPGGPGKEVPLSIVRKRHAPRGEPRETVAPVLLVHGYGQNRHIWHLPARSLPNYLARAGFDVFSLDLRGHGRSRGLGARWPTHVADYVREDVPAAIEAVQRLSFGRRIFYVGHSLGGLIGYAVAPSFAEAFAGIATLGSPYHFARGSLPLALVAGAMLLVDRGVPLGYSAPPLKPLGMTIRMFRSFIESPIFPLPIRGFDAGSMEPEVLNQHMSLALDAGSIAILRNLFLGGVEARRNGHRLGGLTGYAAPFEELDIPLLIIAGTKDDLAPAASVVPAFDHSRSLDKTFRSFPRGHIDLVVGRDAPKTIWPLLERWMRKRVR